MGTAKKLGEKIGSAAKKVGKKLDKAIIQPVTKSIKTIVKDPRALAGVALTMAFPGAGAFLGAKLGLGSGLAAKTVGNVLLKTAINGGNVKAAVLSSAIPLVGNAAGNLIGKTLDSSGITGSLNNVITKAATGGLTAAALGKDPIAAMTFGGVSAALPLVTAQIPGFGDLPDMAKSALTKTLTAQLTGRDPSQALFQSVIDTGVKTANQYLKPELGFAIPEGLINAPAEPPQGLRRPSNRFDQQFKPFKMEERPPAPSAQQPASGIAALRPEDFQSIISKLPPSLPKKEEEKAAPVIEESLGNFEDFIGGFAGSGGSMGYLGAGSGDSGYPNDGYSDYGYAGGDEYSYRDGSSDGGGSAGRGGEGVFGYEMFDTGSGAGSGDFTGSNAADFGVPTTASPTTQPAAQPVAPPAAPSEPVPFGKAFAQARLGGAKTFEWQGKSYTTALAPTTKPAAPSARPAVPSPARSAQPTAAPDSVGGGRGVQGGPTAEELAAYASSQGDTGPFVGYGNAFKTNPQTYKDINDVNDPKTLAFVKGLTGTAPDRLGYSVLNPNAEGIRKAGTAGFAVGTVGQMIPAAAGIRAALPSMRGPSALENYLAGSVTQKPLYHGTASDISQFSGAANKTSTPGIAGWLAQNPEYAAQYARGMGSAGAREGANVMPVYASIKKPMNLDDPEVLKMIKTELPYVNIPPPGLRYTMTEPKQGRALAELAKQKGYDAFKVLDEGQQTFAPLTPAQIKSAIGNRGTYDPFDPRLNYAKGGVAKKSKPKNKLGIAALAVKRNLR
jgi:hypothetical protein